MMNKENYFALSPLSEQTLKKHNWEYKGSVYKNDFGFPCDYRVLVNGKEIGRVKYYAKKCK